MVTYCFLCRLRIISTLRAFFLYFYLVDFTHFTGKLTNLTVHFETNITSTRKRPSSLNFYTIFTNQVIRFFFSLNYILYKVLVLVEYFSIYIYSMMCRSIDVKVLIYTMDICIFDNMVRLFVQNLYNFYT